MCVSLFPERKLFCLARFAPTMQVHNYVYNYLTIGLSSFEER